MLFAWYYDMLLDIIFTFVINELKGCYMDVNLRLPIFFNGEEAKARIALDIDVPLSDCFTMDMVFYSINALSVYVEDDISMTLVHSNGDDYLCSMQLEKVEGLIAESLLMNKYPI